MDQVRLGMIGTGPRGRTLIKFCQLVSQCKLVAVCDLVEAQARLAVEAAGGDAVRCYTDHRRLLEADDIDAVFLVVEPEHLPELICESLAAGKHVLSEVPLAYTLEDCWRIVLAVERSGLKFQLAEELRYMPFVQAWRKLVAEGRLGKILFAEGQYLHGMGDNRYWLDSRTGERLDYRVARDNPHAVKSRLWNMAHPIFYLPHELSPLLSILDDRVTRVSCMSTRRPSYHHEWFPVPDLEVALMHTAKDTIMRLAAGFVVPTLHVETTQHHWYHLMGTQGKVETNRADDEKMKMWLANEWMSEPAQVTWDYDPLELPAAIRAMGHYGTDYFPIRDFVASIIEDRTPPMDIYRAVETAAPAIVATMSAEQRGACLDVPDFRPGPHRAPGAPPCGSEK